MPPELQHTLEDTSLGAALTDEVSLHYGYVHITSNWGSNLISFSSQVTQIGYFQSGVDAEILFLPLGSGPLSYVLLDPITGDRCENGHHQNSCISLHTSMFFHVILHHVESERSIKPKSPENSTRLWSQFYIAAKHGSTTSGSTRWRHWAQKDFFP